MQNFGNQCLDLACAILGNNITAINEDGTVRPVEGEVSWAEEGAHALAAIGEFYRATRMTTLNDLDVVDIGARCLHRQVQDEKGNNRALAYCALGLLSFGPAKQRNLIWEKLNEETRDELDRRLLARSEATGVAQMYNIAKAVARYSMGLSKKDETGRLIDVFLESIQAASTGGYFADDRDQGLPGVFDISGPMSFIFIRQALKLHVNLSLCERKLPSIRTFAEKWVKLLPDIVRSDGLGWAYGRGVGVYGQIYCISIILQFLRDHWISVDKVPVYLDLLRRLFQYFFSTYIDPENGQLVVNDAERAALPLQTTRIISFDTARYLCQWSRLANLLGLSLNVPSVVSKTIGRFVSFDKTNAKEQGLFIYKDASSGLHVQLPLVGGRGKMESDALAFPHCPGIFDWPVNTYMPVLLPELTINGVKVVPSFYGKHCVAGLGLKNSFTFSYDQPELISNDEKILGGIGSCKVSWKFSGSTVLAEFCYKFKQALTINSFRYVIPLSVPHSTRYSDSSFTLGENSLQASVLKDDFGASWAEVQNVYADPAYKTYYGKICYLQTLERNTPLNVKTGKIYRLQIELKPDVALMV